ncbi:MAG: HlyD family type I secretion periplasmic adaptor subunit [Roseiarcus sp.]
MRQNHFYKSMLRKIAIARGVMGIKDSELKMKKARSISDWRPIALAGYTVIILTFGVAGVWAAVEEIDEGVVAMGYVATETNRKTVEHYEDGIIREILVKEGDRVDEGQVLFRLQKVQAEASQEMAQSQLDSALAQEARLVAERDGTSDIAWPKEFAGHEKEATIERVISDQIQQFAQRRATLNDQIEVIEARMEELQKEIDGIEIEKDSTSKQVDYINKELVGLRELGAKQLVPMSRVYAMERERTRLQGDIGRADADAAKAQSSIEEMKLQSQSVKQKFQEDVAAQLLDARQKIAELRERAKVANDVLRRIEITAPCSGTVQDLKVFTVGQVVRSGEPLLQIVPNDVPLIIEAQISPNDIDTIHADMQAEIRFPAFHSRTIPVMVGKLESVSRDRLIDDATHQPFFRGLISLKRADIPEQYRTRIRPGMPAQVIVAAGSRTVLSYLVSPLTSSLRTAFREPND